MSERSGNAELLAKLEEDLFEMEYYGYGWEKDGTEITINFYESEDGSLPPRSPFNITTVATFDVPETAGWSAIYFETLRRMHRLVGQSSSRLHYLKNRLNTFNFTWRVA